MQEMEQECGHTRGQKRSYSDKMVNEGAVQENTNALKDCRIYTIL